MTTKAFVGNPLNVADQEAYDAIFIHSAAFKWEPVQREKGNSLTAMPNGLMRAVVYGDPNKPGLCMFRMKYPPRYHVPSHVHWMAEHTAVLEGEVWVGLGETVDESKMI
jgi:quercetin dioxygenase-like cupin family protein